MICDYAVPIITTVDGPREHVERPCDTESRLHLEQALDLGDAELHPLLDLGIGLSAIHATHRIMTHTGGVFHARMSEGRRDRPSVHPPAELRFLFEMTSALDRWCRSMETQIAALRLLEAEVASLRKELGR